MGTVLPLRQPNFDTIVRALADIAQEFSRIENSSAISTSKKLDQMSEQFTMLELVLSALEKKDDESHWKYDGNPHKFAEIERELKGVERQVDEVAQRVDASEVDIDGLDHKLVDAVANCTLADSDMN
ncbi:hypothetical protein E4U54_007218 [Claviceps lovelessii]|nr:hypothetical protein E4U54_007218 [Claviceps lovelessii]